MNVTWAYVAGFFDGEGTVLDRLHSTGVRQFSLWFPQTEREVLDHLQEFFESEGIKSTITSYHSGPRQTKRHRLGIANVSGVYTALERMYPHLIVKREKAEAMMEVIEANILEVLDDPYCQRAHAYRPLIAGSLTIPA